MKKKAFYGWKLLAAFWFIYLVNLGFPTYGQSVVNAYMAKDLHLDRTMLGLAFSLYMLMVGLPGPAVAALVNRIGVRKTLLIGSCSAMLGALSMALFVHTGWQAVLRRWSDCRATGNRPMVHPQTRAGAFSHVQWRRNRRIYPASVFESGNRELER
jgi:MFS family permease